MWIYDAPTAVSFLFNPGSEGRYCLVNTKSNKSDNELRASKTVIPREVFLDIMLKRIRHYDAVLGRREKKWRARNNRGGASPRRRVAKAGLGVPNYRRPFFSTLLRCSPWHLLDLVPPRCWVQGSPMPNDT